MCIRDRSSKSTYYLFIGKATPFTTGTSGGSDTSPPTPADSVSREFYDWDAMTGAKLISSSDVTFALPRRNWANNTTYDMYDDTISSSNTATSGASSLYSSNVFSGILNTTLRPALDALPRAFKDT